MSLTSATIIPTAQWAGDYNFFNRVSISSSVISCVTCSASLIVSRLSSYTTLPEGCSLQTAVRRAQNITSTDTTISFLDKKIASGGEGIRSRDSFPRQLPAARDRSGLANESPRLGRAYLQTVLSE